MSLADVVAAHLNGQNITITNALEQSPFIVWGTFAIAVYGVLQPWIIAGVRRFLDRREIVIAESLRPQIFFGTPTGPAIGMYGTIFNKSKQTAVKTLLVMARRISNNEQHAFEARLFRKNSFVNPQDGTFATPFMIEPNSASPYSMEMHEPASTREFEALYKTYAPAWNAYVRSKALPNQTFPMSDDAYNQLASNAWKMLISGGVPFPAFYMDAYNALNRMFFWRAGDWALRISVIVLDDATSYVRDLEITLSQEDENGLLGNTVQMLAAWAGQPFQFYAATPEYRVCSGKIGNPTEA